MRSKRLLTMLLVVCMLVSALSPAVSAVAISKDSVLNNKNNTSIVAENKTSEPNSMLVTGNTTGIQTLNEDSMMSQIVTGSNGSWVATESDKTPSIAKKENAELQKTLEELQEAAVTIKKDNVVTAFVVMEAAPLAEKYTSIAQMTATEKKDLLDVQNRVIEQIEKTVLKGGELNVRYQFAYLTNAFSIQTEMKHLEKIAQLENVKSVYIVPVYNAIPSENVANPNTSSAAGFTGVADVWNELGYTGQGMKIAIVDTGLDLDHPSFAAAPEGASMTHEDITNVLEDLNSYARKRSLTAADLYRSEKVPYAFNYCDDNLSADHSKDQQGDHGTHVAGIAAANATEGTSVVGMAPDAQLLVMKVFGKAGGAYTDDIVAAVEDAMTLGADVVNLSLGSAAGFTTENPEVDMIYERLNSQDIIATISAGNEDVSSDMNMWGTDLNRTQNPDNATIGSPGIFANATTIASADNAELPVHHFTLADGTEIGYNDPATYHESYYLMHNFLAGMEPEYVIIDGLGDVEDFYDEDGNSLVEGKIAVIKRGTLAFGEKAYNAQNAGAIGAIIWNNAPGDVYSFGMDLLYNDDYPYITVSLISLEDGQKMADAAVKTLTVSDELIMVPNATAGQMSSFSSWGVAPNLSLEPDITGIGGSVYSTLDDGQYGLMSGTSMSAPQVAGISALMLQHLKELYPNAIDGSLRDLAEAMLMSTADPIMAPNPYTGVELEASPRQQGSGLVDAWQALNTEVYLTVGGNSPKASLGDSTSGNYVFSFEIHNTSDEAKTFELDSTLMSEDVESGYDYYWMAGFETELSGSVTFDKDTVTVPAGEKRNVKVTIRLSDEDKAYFDECWENGGYVEGFVYATSTDAEGVVEELSLPFLGFYGDWTEAPVFDSAYWYDNSMWDTGDGWPEGDEYWHIFWTNVQGQNWVLGFNLYSGAVADADGNVIYDPAHNVVSPNGDGVIDGLDEIYLSLLRNAKTLTFTYTVDGEVVHAETIENNSKTMYYSSYGQVVPWLYSWYGTGMYDFSGLESGTEVILTIDATVDYKLGGEHQMVVPIYVDTQAPELVGIEEIEVNGNYYLAVTAKDDVAMASVVLMNPAGNRIHDQSYDTSMIENEDGSWTTYFDVSDLGTEFLVVLCDYGCNEAGYDVEYTIAGDNTPDMSEYLDQIFAYRVYDNYIYSDHMYGWVSLATVEGEEGANGTAHMSVWSDDYLEETALRAAEYAGGKIFATDVYDRLYVLEPGVFDRKYITTTTASVMDMAFDDSTDTMYVLAKQSSYVYLYTMDLMTGKLTQLKYFGYYDNAPYAIADDDNGTLYAIGYAKNGLYTLTAENNWAMTPIKVTDADGIESDLVIKDYKGNAVSPQYEQSITYVDGMLFWAYYKYSYSGDTTELMVIDTETFEVSHYNYVGYGYDYEGNLVSYEPDLNLVGLLSLQETDFQIEEATALTDLVLSETSLLMKVGDIASVTATPLPWNYDVQSMTWTSADESVAAIVNGQIVAKGAGETTITVTADGISKTIPVKVVAVEGNFHAYSYYSGDGYTGFMIDVDMATMNYDLDGAAPVDFISGDYNGHDGCFYGYTENGQLYCWDKSINEIYEIGPINGSFPVDMAYDYSSGLMCGLYTDMNTYETEIRVINMKSGATHTLIDLTQMFYVMGLMTLAADSQGNLYALDYAGTLYVMDAATGMPYAVPMGNLGSASYVQSMCWDYENNVLLWANCDGNSINWIDVYGGYMLQLGDPTESGVFEYVGMYTIPENIPELPYTPVSSIESSDMLILVDGVKTPNVTIYPFNATNQTLVMTSADESVAKIENGAVVGVGAGETTINYAVVDGDNVVEGSFNVTVLQGADNMYGHILSDLTYGQLSAWAELYPHDTANPGYGDYFDYVLFAEEYVDGKIYGYGYDANDWEANWQYFVFDAATFKTLSQSDLGESFPYVYDMTYDYTTGTMYCVAGNSEDEMNLYVADIATGKVALLKQTEQNFMSIAAARDGKLYAIENSKECIVGWEEDDLYGDLMPVYGLANAQLYCIDAKTLEITHVGDTGMQCNMIASMAYDYDTDVMYWTALSTANGINGLAIVDLETGAATNLGCIGATGSQVSGLYIVADEYPETKNDELYHVIINPAKTALNVGQSTSLSLITVPGNLNGASITWKSSNSNVATVDQNGTVTALAQGQADIIVSVKFNGQTVKATCPVAVLTEDAAFLTWNRTDMGWTLISRADYTVSTNLTEGEAVGVTAMANVGADVYAIDENNCLFKLNTETYERAYIGTELKGDFSNLPSGYDFDFVVRDMAYDAANERMLVLGAAMLYDLEMDYYDELTDGCRLYELDLTTGEMKAIYTFTDYVSIYSLAAGTNGEVYFYTVFNDGVYKLNTQTKEVTTIVTLQTMSIYGEYGFDIRQAMHYDELTGNLYITLTTNANYYRMICIDAATGTITAYTEEGTQLFVGEVTKQGYYYYGDLFAGLAFPYEAVEAPEAPETVIEAPVVTASNVAKTGKVKLTWNEVEGAVKYEVYRATTKDGEYKKMYTTEGTSYSNTKATAGKYYYYYVVAVAEDGTSAASEIVGRTCDLARPEVTASNVAKTGKVRLTWNAVEGAVEYKIYRSTEENGEYKLMYTTTGTSYTNTKAEAGVTYYYKVVAVATKSAANSAAALVSRTCDLPQTKLTGKVNLVGNPKLSWDKVEGAVSYKVYRAESENGTYKLMKTTTGTSYTNTNNVAGTTYYYYVVAVCENTWGNSAASNIVSLTAK